MRLLRLETLLHCFNDFTIYVPTASSTLLFLSSVVGSLQGSLVRRKARPNQIGGMAAGAAAAGAAAAGAAAAGAAAAG